MRIVSRTDTGRVRKKNEDFVAFDESGGIAVLADGMGGMNAGEVASENAVATILSYLRSELESDPGKREASECARVLSTAIERANETVFEMSNSHYDYYGMGTTLVCAVKSGADWLIGHVGDSRAYSYSQGRGLKRLTRDHSLVQQLVDEGVLSEADARRSPNRNIVTRAVGIGADVESDVQVLTLEEQQGDLLLLCSDGLSDLIEDREIEAHCAALASKCPKLVKKLVNRANDLGGSDNISVLIIEF